MAAILNFAFKKKNPKGLETHIRRDINTSMVVMHNQKRKKYISQNKATHLGCRTKTSMPFNHASSSEMKLIVF